MVACRKTSEYHPAPFIFFPPLHLASFAELASFPTYSQSRASQSAVRTGAGISLALAAAVHYERREARHCKAEQRLNLGTIRAIGPAEKDANNKPCHAVNGPIVWWQLCAECGRFNGDTSLSIDWTEGGGRVLGSVPARYCT